MSRLLHRTKGILLASGSRFIVAPFTAANTPATSGAELLSNPSWDANTVGWTAGVTAGDIGPISSEAGGQTNNCLQVKNAVASTGQTYAFQSINVTAGNVYLLQIYHKNGINFGSLLLESTEKAGDLTSLANQNDAAFALKTMTARANAATLVTRLVVASAANDRTTFYDTVTLKLLDVTTIYDLKADTTANGLFQAALTCPAGLQAGIAHLDDATNPQNGWAAYIDVSNAKAYLDSLSAGTWANVKNGAITYVAGAPIKVIRSGTGFSLYYNGAQVSTAGTIAGLPALTQFGAFRPNTGATVASCYHA